MGVNINAFISQLKANASTIRVERKKALDHLAAVINRQISEEGSSVVKFVCTHNSRRSQLAEFCMDILARENGLPIMSLSAGTESTAFNPRMVKAIESFGFELIKYGQEPNPLYIYRISHNDLYYYSKKWDEELINYGKNIIVTVCDDAGENCPVIPSTFERIHLNYKDPKAFDNTPDESKAYSDKVIEIGTEMHYIIEQLSSFKKRT